MDASMGNDEVPDDINDTRQEIVAFNAITDYTDLALMPGLNVDAQRILDIHDMSGNPPPRSINLGKQDPFNLLVENDTYQKRVKDLYTDCEGLFRAIASENPEVGSQARSLAKNGRGRVVLPKSELQDRFEFELVRSQDKASTEYFFHRSDPMHQDSGFRILKKSHDDHVLFNNVNGHDSDELSDNDYHKQISLATNWIRDYSIQMKVNPNALRALAESPYKPYSSATRIRKIGYSAMHSLDPIADFAKNVVTVKRPGHSRRPRLLAYAAVAACMPPGANCIGVEAAKTAGPPVLGAVDGTGNFIGGILSSGPGFDSHHYQLPGSAVIKVGSINHKIKYDPSLSNTIYSGAPSAKNSLAIGKIRKINPDHNYNYNNGWNSGYGLTGRDSAPNNKCYSLSENLHNAKLIRIVNSNPEISGGLTVSVSDHALYICNESNTTMHGSDIYAEAEN
jgi:hypothetical protein